MTPSDAISSNIRTARIHLTILQARLQPTLTALELTAHHLDGYPTTASGSDNGPPGNNTTSSVERAVIARCDTDPEGHWNRNPVAALTEGHDLARTLLAVLGLLTDWCDTHAGTRLTATELDQLRCQNWRRDDPHSCGNFATPRRHNNQTIDDRRCLACGLRADRLEDERRVDSDRRRLDRHKAVRTISAGEHA
jgi:hypothetical protein